MGPQLDIKYMLTTDNISQSTTEAIWKYVHTLLLISSTIDAPTDSLEDVINGWSKVLDDDSTEHTPEFFESIQKQAETLFNLIGQLNEDDDVNMFAEVDEEFDEDQEKGDQQEGADVEENESSDDDDEQDPFEKIQNSKVGKLAQELANEVSIDEFVDTESLKNAKHPKDAFKNFLGK